ncbi:MAG TPA: hypothetical protein VFF48_06330 [Brevundimonas sp.]|nr:hypothetical protein [Brevundimonas sp.]
MIGGRKSRTAVQALMAASLAAPLLVLVSALGTRTGLMPPEIGYDLLTLKVGLWLAFVGAAAALAAAFLAVRDFRRRGVLAAIALVAGLGTLGGHIWQHNRLAAGPSEDISTNLADIPGFGDLPRAGAGQGPASVVGAEACPGALPAMTQIAPESAAWALQRAGFSVRRAGVARANGAHRGFWFGFHHDAVIRIRPGRTDVRVAARDGRPHAGAACRMATRISEALRSGR